MRSVATVPTVLFLLFTAFAAVAATTDPGDAYHIVLSRNAVSAGEQVEMKLVPPVPAGIRVSWPTATGKDRLTYSAVYRAPFVIPEGAPPAKVSVSIWGSGMKMTVSAVITLLPSSVPEAGGCLGPGQSFSTTTGTIVPDYTAADDLPRLVHAVPPDYPRSDLARGVEDTIAIRALLCRTGHVLDAYAPPSYLRVGDLHSIEHDPKLVEAAIGAVRQYVFTPAMKSGQPIAVWIDVPVAFRR